MRRPSAATLLSYTFIAVLLGTALFVNVTKPRVMILQSYDPGYPWTREIDVGIRRVSQDWSSYALSWYYMDTKRHNDPDWLRRAGILARRAIDKLDPQVLIAVDDTAQRLAASHYVDRPGLAIVFAGVNGSAAPYGYPGAANVTGIFEHKPLQAIKEIALAFEARRPRPKPHPRILYILDPSPSLRADRPYIEAFDWTPLEFAGSVVAKDFPDWQRLVRERGPRVDYLVVANYRKLPRGPQDPRLADPKRVMAWTEAESPVPVIGANVFNVEDGAMISVGASPYEQGEVAAHMAQRILREGIPASAIPFRINRQYVVALRRSALRRRGLRLPSVYEAFSRATATYLE